MQNLESSNNVYFLHRFLHKSKSIACLPQTCIAGRVEKLLKWKLDLNGTLKLSLET